VALVFEGLNVTLNKEASSVDCQRSSTGAMDTCTIDYVGPVTIPSVGVEVYW
jgi:hypothetical protein